MPQLETPGDVQYQHQLPTVSFRVIDDDPSLLKAAGVHGEQMKHYGYNNLGDDFNRPEHYIRHIEPIESELAMQVEYDMDEQDQAWLDAINAERKKEQSGAITYEVFEIIMDKLEKEWFNLVKRIPQPASHMPVEDSKCAVCDDGEGENSNAIVFCDGCNLAVHQDCYGVPYIPEGQWLCRKCTVSPENPVSCLVCPNEGGAFKQTTSGHWAHLLCAIWIPELQLGNAIYMEPIDGVEAIPKNRWKLVCSLCREKMGACIQCENRNCFTAFHVTCARQMGYLMAMKSVHNDGSLKAFCDKHLPDELRKDTFDDEFDSEFSGTPLLKQRRASCTGGPAVTTKTARAHAKSYRPGPPIVPQLIVNALNEYTSKLTIRKKAGFMERLCRYWSLKREARRGAPLLKRLHLEPWTASNAGRQQTEAEKELKLSFLRMLRNDLEKIRMLAELARKREREKLKQAQAIKDVVDGFIFPGYEKLRLVLEKVSSMDQKELFLHPVNRFEVPDYFQVIKEPMSWMQMDDKLEKNMYRDTATFKRDVELVLDNAMLYNKADTPFHKTAKRIKTNVQPLLLELDTLGLHSTILPPDEDLDVSSIPETAIGDLEPSLLLLKSLLNTSDVTPEQDNLASLFLFEMTRPRPPTPTPPPAPSPPKRRATANQEKQKRREEREAAAKATKVVRATRSVINANSAFAQEAGLVPSDTEAHSRHESGESSRPTRRSGLSGPVPVDAPPEGKEGVKEGKEVVKDSRGRVRKGRESVKEGKKRARESSTVGTPAVAESSVESRPRGRQVGVVAVETVAVISDKERRQRELELDLVTEQVGDKDQFTRFNVGWVLPPGTKRRRPESPHSVNGMLGVPRGRTTTTSPLVQAASLPPAPTPPPADVPPPSSPLSAASSESLTPPESEEDEPRPNAEAGPSTQPGAAESSAKGDSSKSKRKRKSLGHQRPFGSRPKRRKVEPAAAEAAEAEEDGGKEMDEAPEPEVPVVEEQAVIVVESEDDLTPMPESQGDDEPTTNPATPQPPPSSSISAAPTPKRSHKRGEGKAAMALRAAKEAELAADTAAHVEPAATTPRRSHKRKQPETAMVDENIEGGEEAAPGAASSPPPPPPPKRSHQKGAGKKPQPTPPQGDVDAAEVAIAPLLKRSHQRGAGRQSHLATAQSAAPSSPQPTPSASAAPTPSKRSHQKGAGKKAQPAPVEVEAPAADSASAPAEPEAGPLTHRRTRSGDIPDPAPEPAQDDVVGETEAEAPPAEPRKKSRPAARKSELAYLLESGLVGGSSRTEAALPERGTRTKKAEGHAEAAPAVADPEPGDVEMGATEPEAAPAEVASAEVLEDEEAPQIESSAQVKKRSGRKSQSSPVLADPEPVVEVAEAKMEESADWSSGHTRRRSGRRFAAVEEEAAEPDMEVEEAEPEREAGSEAEGEIVAEPVGSDARSDAEESGEEDLFPAGTLVWAKIPRYPWFPAVIIDYSDNEIEISDAVVDAQPDVEGERHWLVQFYDSGDTFAWVNAENLDKLGEPNGRDEWYLAGKHKDGTRKRAFKNKHEVSGVRKAYKLAQAEMASLTEDEE